MSETNKSKDLGFELTRTCCSGVCTSNSRKDLRPDSSNWSDGSGVWLADFLCACNDVCHDNSGGSSSKRCDGAGAGSKCSCAN